MTIMLSLQNGIIHYVTDFVISQINRVNLSEIAKTSAVRLCVRTGRTLSLAEEISIKSTAADLYIILKWFTILSFWIFGLKQPIIQAMTWFLVFINTFAYFYQYIWKIEIHYSHERARRRFAHVIQGIAFSILCYSYFYDVVYFRDLSWPQNRTFVEAICFSLGNALTVTYGDIMPITSAGRIVCSTQLVNMFLFAAVVVSSSIPEQIRHARSEISTSPAVDNSEKFDNAEGSSSLAISENPTSNVEPKRQQFT